MSSSTNFFEKMSQGISSNLHTAIIARIEKIDLVKMKANIKPLSKLNLGGQFQDVSIIPDVPVMLLKAGNFFIRPPYSVGDLVYVVFAEHDIDNIMLTGKEEQPNSTRNHALDDAIVIGAVMPYTNSLTSDNANDLLVAKTDMSSKVILKDSGDIVIESSGNLFLGSESAAEGVPLGDQLKSWLDGHVHPNTDPIDPSLTKPPTSSSPSPSSKVKVI